MKRALSRTLALIGWGLATFAVTPAHAQTTANGPYYATPSWDQTLPSANSLHCFVQFQQPSSLGPGDGIGVGENAKSIP